jgi:hypothetical protein
LSQIARILVWLGYGRFAHKRRSATTSNDYSGEKLSKAARRGIEGVNEGEINFGLCIRARLRGLAWMISG